MKLIYKYVIKNDADLLFCKIDIRNYLKKHKKEYVEDFIFALMELGTNILKHAKKGEIWFLGIECEYMLAALDKANGIKNIDWALKEGTTTKKSLGLGLYSLNNMDNFELKVLSLNDEDYHGSVFLFKPKKNFADYVFLIQNYLGLKDGGDFIYKKNRFFILGDVNGHGRKAKKSAIKIVEFFKKRVISCILIEDIFRELNEYIKSNDLRGVVLSIVEKSKYLSICGIGNIKIFSKNWEKIKIFSQKNGILGDSYNGVSKYTFEFKEMIGLFSDGIEERAVKKVVLKCDDIFLCAIGALFFSKTKDDKSILIFKEKK